MAKIGGITGDAAAEFFKRFEMAHPGRVLADLFNMPAEKRGDNYRAEIGADSTRQVIVNPVAAGDTGVEGVDQFIEEHLGRVGKNLAVWIRAECRLVGQGILQNQRQPPQRLPAQCPAVQILDLGYAENWEKKNGSKPDWFTCHGDVFPCGPSKMKPFAPAAPNGARSFPTRETTRPFGEWNRYYIRCLNGEGRLWVNGTEISGGTECTPAEGPIAFEAEGAPIRYRDIWIRELP